MQKEGKINWRSFVALYMGFSFVLMLITGIMLYIAPPGRIAHWTNWKFLGFTKTEWQALHTIFSFIWGVFATLHIVFNWNALMIYFRKKFQHSLQLTKEFTFASLLTIIVFLGTYFEIPPFSTIMDLGEYATNSWATESNEPPIPHAELLTLKEFSNVIKLPYSKIISELTKNEIEIPDTTFTLKQIAEVNNIAPSKIYLFLDLEKHFTNNSVGKYFPGSGLGRKMLSEIFNENKINWGKGIEILRKNGINVKEDAKLKELAEENDVSPIKIIEILMNK